jgi:hypothetical protein
MLDMQPLALLGLLQPPHPPVTWCLAPATAPAAARVLSWSDSCCAWEPGATRYTWGEEGGNVEMHIELSGIMH